MVANDDPMSPISSRTNDLSLSSVAGADRVSKARFRTLSYYLALCVSIITIANNWSDFGFPAFITGNRVGAVLLFLGIGVMYVRRPYRAVAVSRGTWPLVLMLLFIFFWAAVSLLVGGHAISADLVSVLPWLLTAVCVCFYGMLLPRLKGSLKYLVNGLIVNAFIMNIFSALTIASAIGFGELAALGGPGVRVTIHEAFSTGLNRHLTGLVLINLLSVATALSVLRRSGLIKWLSYVNLMLLFGICVISGSRQNLFGLILYAVLVVIMSHGAQWRWFKRTRISKAAPLTPLLVVATVIAFVVFTNPVASEWISTRFVQTLNRATEGDSERLNLLFSGLSTVAEYPLWGAGPGTFVVLHGQYAHNSYLQVAAELGIIPVFVIISTIFAALVFTHFGRPDAENAERSGTSVALITGCWVFVLWSANFNELLADPAFWILLITAGALSNRRHIRAQSHLRP